MSVLEAYKAALDKGLNARTVEFESKEEQRYAHDLFLLTAKPVLYVCNVDETAAQTGNQYSEMIAKVAKEQGITRSMAAMRSFGQDMNGAIIAIGNAPTALFEVLRMVEEENLRPAAIVGIPVGFVGAADSKAELAANTLVPYATVEGTKGGSPIAAAVVNAIMYIIDNNRD